MARVDSRTGLACLFAAIVLLVWFYCLGHDDPFGVGEVVLPLQVSGISGSVAAGRPGPPVDGILVVDRSSKAAWRSFATAARGCLSGGWTLLCLYLILAKGIGARLVERASRPGRHPVVTSIVFAFLLLVSQVVLHLPLVLLNGLASAAIDGLSGATALSHAGLAFLDDFSWLCLGVLAAVGQFCLIRIWPRMWWCLGWAISVPLLVGGLWLQVYLRYEAGPFRSVQVLAKDGPHAKLRLLADAMGLGRVPIILTTGANAGRSVIGHTFDFLGHREIWIQHLDGVGMDETELLGTLCHEAGHVKLRHARTMVLVTAVTSLGFHALLWLLLRMTSGGGRPELRLLLLPRLQALGLVALLVAAPASLAVQRALESDAERFALETLHDGPGFAAGWARMVRDLDLDPYPNVVRRLWGQHCPSVAEYLLFCNRYRRASAGK